MNPNGLDSQTRKLIRKRISQVIIQFLFIGVILFLSAGSIDWVWAWVYLALGLTSTLIATPVMLRKNPEVIAERAEIKKDTKRFDRIFMIYSLVLTLGMFIAAGLDYRFGWTDNYLLYFYLIGFILTACGNVLLYWAMISNKYFSRTVRIQDERNHSVVNGGPYNYVRHPGYSGLILSLIGTPLLLGSLWALIPAVLVIIGYFVRTHLEDSTLQKELSGYKLYEQKTRFRLIPGIW